MITRCPWAKTDLLIHYHDTQWGREVHNDKKLFEMLVLEAMQAGLSWEIVLKKRDAYKKATNNFSLTDLPSKEAIFEAEGIIKNVKKVDAIITNAQAFKNIQKEYVSFDSYIWKFVNHTPIHNHWEEVSQIPAHTDLSTEISKDLKRHGFVFMGPVTCYAFMQAVGIVQDHIKSCFRYTS